MEFIDDKEIRGEHREMLEKELFDLHKSFKKQFTETKMTMQYKNSSNKGRKATIEYVPNLPSSSDDSNISTNFSNLSNLMQPTPKIADLPAMKKDQKMLKAAHDYKNQTSPAIVSKKEAKKMKKLSENTKPVSIIFFKNDKF